MGSDLVVRRPVGFTEGQWAIDAGVRTPSTMPTMAQVSKAINRLMTERDGQYCGFPMPLPGLGLHLADGHPMAEMVAQVQEIVDGDAPKAETVCGDLGWQVVNEWRGTNTSGVPGRVYVLRHEDGRTRAGFLPSAPRRNRFIFGPFDTMDAWDINAEMTAMERLGALLPARQFKAYAMTGQFIERSKRSGVAYIFRRLRPTIAIRCGRSPDEFFSDDPGDGDASILACLCLHPLAYYERTFCGAMVPTDDVIAHLMLMRGDEHLYWRRANQHHPLDPESGL